MGGSTSIFLAPSNCWSTRHVLHKSFLGVYYTHACTQSELSDVSPNEDFTTSLGADQSIRITCHPVAVVHGSKSGVLSKSSVITYTHLFHVKNTRADAVQLQVSEQVPLSTDDRIKVRK